MKVLIAVDIADPHDDLIEHVSWMLPIEKADVTLLYVREALPEYDENVGAATSDLGEWDLMIEEKANAVLEGLEQSLKDAASSVKREIVVGAPAFRIATVAKSFDLTVVAPGKASTIERFLMGSVSSKIVEITPGMVMILKDHKGHERLDHVLFAVDGSKQSNDAIRQAVAFLGIKERNVKTTVMNVVSVPPVLTMMSPAGLSVAVEKNLEMSGQVAIAASLKVLSELGITDTESNVATGDAADMLLKHAEKIGAQLIVAGSRGHTAFERLLMGSVASRIVSHSHCSAAIVRS